MDSNVIRPTAEQIEQCAQVCWEAQRALLLSRGLASVATPAPPHWHGATDAERQTARERVCELWREVSRSGPPPSSLRFEDILARAMVRAFVLNVMAEEIL